MNEPLKIVKVRNEFCVEIFREGEEPRRIVGKYVNYLENFFEIIEEMFQYNVGKSPHTINTWLSRVIKCVYHAVFDHDIKNQPKSTYEWEHFIKALYATCIAREDQRASITTRVKVWNASLRPFLSWLQDRDRIPLDVIIPTARRIKTDDDSHSFKITLLEGEKPKEITPANYQSSLLYDVGLHRTDAEYLERIHYELEKRSSLVYSCCINYWKCIKAHYDFGQHLIRSTSHDELESALDQARNFRRGQPSLEHPLKPNTKAKLKLFLTYANSRGQYFPYKDGGLSLTYRSSIYRLSKIVHSLLPPLHKDMNSSLMGNLTATRLNWTLGALSYRDVAFLILLLTYLNPKWNFTPLLEAELRNKDGKAWLEFSENGIGFSIDKKRSKERKHSDLCEISIEILEFLVETNATRKPYAPEHLKDRLFVCHSKGKIVSPRSANIISHIIDRNHKNNNTITGIFPKLKDAGLSKTLSFSSLRTTMGVLEWFKSGSVSSASKTLGNSKRIALKHYIPPQLIDAFNTRRVRQFQNILIIAATKDKDYMLEATDFSTLGELNLFIKNQIEESPGKNPLLSVIDSGQKAMNSDSELIASLSSSTLEALYTYKYAAIDANISFTTLSETCRTSNLSPITFITLSSYVERFMEKHSDPALVMMHKEALDKAKSLLDDLKWRDLFISREFLSAKS